VVLLPLFYKKEQFGEEGKRRRGEEAKSKISREE
jgi:hypothetical protein